MIGLEYDGYNMIVGSYLIEIPSFFYRKLGKFEISKILSWKNIFLEAFFYKYNVHEFLFYFSLRPVGTYYGFFSHERKFNDDR